MLRKFLRLIRPNPLDSLLKKARKRKAKKVVLGWNRGLGDIALGLYATVQRITDFLPDAEITFVIRENLQEGFALFPRVKTIVAKDWIRGRPYNIKETLKNLQIDPTSFDLLIEKPNPTYWVKWQLGKVVPKLQWNPSYDLLNNTFDLPKGVYYVGVQIEAETKYGLWRNWPAEKWNELFSYYLPRDDVKFLLFGYGKETTISFPNVIDLRGKTSLFSLLALIKTKCTHLILPDSGILSMVYFLDVAFPITVISLWGDPKHGILKQNVSSPNPLLTHIPVISTKPRDLSSVKVEEILPLLKL